MIQRQNIKHDDEDILESEEDSELSHDLDPGSVEKGLLASNAVSEKDLVYKKRKGIEILSPNKQH